MTAVTETPILFVTGTDTDVGKTIATAAIASALAVLPGPSKSTLSVAIDKPTQTGVMPDEPGDIDEISRLSGVRCVTEGIRLKAPMAPVAAAAREFATLPALSEHVNRIHRLTQIHNRVIVEGAGGVLVRLDQFDHTLADLAASFGNDAAAIVVCRSGLGTLNHTELTLEALRNRGVRVAGIIIGSWPNDPSEIELDNRQFFESLEVPLLGAIPEGSSRLDPAVFRHRAVGWLALSTPHAPN
ncbi:MAG: ATP-dependent dethiobiotin synthetase BioD [Microbacteriaceae bacterium]|nr:ATP-dependent dethiobiotin synthetase BioD [Microbacteriaceae bacterium]